MQTTPLTNEKRERESARNRELIDYIADLTRRLGTQASEISKLRGELANAKKDTLALVQQIDSFNADY